MRTIIETLNHIKKFYSCEKTKVSYWMDSDITDLNTLINRLKNHEYGESKVITQFVNKYNEIKIFHYDGIDNTIAPSEIITVFLNS